MIVLTLESTCDETAAAVVTDELQVLGQAVATQESLHEQFNGVVPEIAARAHLERILPVMQLALERAHVRLDQLDAVAVANTPGLAGSLVISLMAAKTLALVLDIPLVGINHVHAHIYACQIAAQRNVYPCVGFAVSGGHTSLFDCEAPTKLTLLGGTIDDAAGEAFDKVGSMLGLAFPGGPALSKLAEQGNPAAYSFPRSFLKEDRLAFSFSGLKTAVRYAITGPGKVDLSSVTLTAQQKADLAASFEAAVVDCLVGKALQAIQQTGRRVLCVGGGVAANRLFRQHLQTAAEKHSIELHFAPYSMCTDNAVMGALAVERLRLAESDSLDLDVIPGLMR